MRVAAYLRVSTEEQTRGFGLVEQREKLELFCQFKGWDKIRWFDDPGYSGGNLDRPGLQALLQAVKRQRVDVVLVYKSDRLSRKLKDLLTLIEDVLESHQVAFISATEDFNTATASGKAFLSMLGTFSEFERNTIRERTLGGKRQAAKVGKHCHGQIPLGYKDSVDGLAIDSEGAESIKLIFLLRKQGMSLQNIVDQLNQEGRKTKKGGKWYRCTIKYILENPKYQGVMHQELLGETYELSVPALKIA